MLSSSHTTSDFGSIETALVPPIEQLMIRVIRAQPPGWGTIISILSAMREVDARYVTKSLYRDLADGEQDEAPDGETFNTLWDSIVAVVERDTAEPGVEA
jgi:hypothetical protein